MCRDYVLGSGERAIHIEAKHRWSGWRSIDFSDFLMRLNRNEWSGTERDGPFKDLALLLWGATALSARRAALIDETRIVVLLRSPSWTVGCESQMFEDSPAAVGAALQALAP